MNENEQSLITIINENKPGMLSKITGYCGENGINIEKLVISAFKTDNLLHRIIMYVTGNRARINSLIDGFLDIDGVVSVNNFVSLNYIERELMLLKINTDDECFEDIKKIAEKYSAKTILANRNINIFQFVEKNDIIEEITIKIEKFRDASVEILKTGIVATNLEKIEMDDE
jgi:acetolactate synthase-1/3 small subunit